MIAIMKLKKGAPTREISNMGETNWSRRFKTMEAAALRLQKESKGYLDSLRGRCALARNE